MSTKNIAETTEEILLFRKNIWNPKTTGIKYKTLTFKDQRDKVEMEKSSEMKRTRRLQSCQVNIVRLSEGGIRLWFQMRVLANKS